MRSPSAHPSSTRSLRFPSAPLTLVGLPLFLAAALVLGAGCKPDPAGAPAEGAESGQPALPEQPGRGDDAAPDDPPAEATEPPTEARPTDIPCESDADCVPDDCCHAKSCVAAANAPDCAEVMCTMDCQAGTMDCGGGCACTEGKCVAHVVAADAWSPR